MTRARPEQVLHRQVADFLRVALGGSAMFFHIPNAAKRGLVEGRIFKAMGVKAGMPDICILDGGRACFIELKAGKGRVTDSQRSAHLDILRARCPTAVCRSLDEVIAFLHHEGVPLKVAHTGTAG